MPDAIIIIGGRSFLRRELGSEHVVYTWVTTVSNVVEIHAGNDSSEIEAGAIVAVDRINERDIPTIDLDVAIENRPAEGWFLSERKNIDLGGS